MKKVEIKKFTYLELSEPSKTIKPVAIPITYELIRAEGEELIVSDGYHTFDELYEHRITLFITLCKTYDRMAEIATKGQVPSGVWRSQFHSDGSFFEGWFVLGIGKSIGDQITYHLSISKWDETYFAETLDKAPEWDNHTSADVLLRLKSL